MGFPELLNFFFFQKKKGKKGILFSSLRRPTVLLLLLLPQNGSLPGDPLQALPSRPLPGLPPVAGGQDLPRAGAAASLRAAARLRIPEVRGREQPGRGVLPGTSKIEREKSY